jgi:transposase
MVNVGVDLHKTQFTICARSRDNGEYFARYATDEEGYRAFFSLVSKWQKNGEEVRAGVESTGNTRYFKNRMEAAGVEVKVINPLKMKVVNESVKKTDKHDAATIAEFLEKDMLPLSQLCSRESEQIRRYLKVRTSLVKTVTLIKNQIHALFLSEGLADVKSADLQSKIGRKRILDALNQCTNGLAAQPLLEMIDRLEENINGIEKQIRAFVKGDRTVELLMTIPGCGEICAWTIRAYTDDIKRFANPKKYASFAGLAPWVQNSNETVRHGKITKRGPKELRTALVQVVMGLRRMKAKTISWHLIKRYDIIKQSKGSGKAIIATARKISVMIWHILTNEAKFELERMTNPKLVKKTEVMRRTMGEKKDGVLIGKQKKSGVASIDKKKQEGKKRKVG